MTNSATIHPATEQRLKNFLARPAHSLILAAPAGSGKTTLALWLVSQITGQSIEQLNNNPYLKIIQPEGKSISIDQVRELGQFLKLKTTGKANLRRFVIVEQAETLTTEAQNAFLKLFEEPPADTLIILNVSNIKSLLPTVLSRAQSITIRQPAKSQLESALDKPHKDFEKFYNLSGGRVGLLIAMSTHDEQHVLIEAVEAAKSLLKASKFEQLSIVDELAKRKDDGLVLEALQLIATSGLAQAADQQDRAALRRWQKILTAAYDARTALQNGAQAKLTFTNLLLNL